MNISFIRYNLLHVAYHQLDTCVVLTCLVKPQLPVCSASTVVFFCNYVKQMRFKTAASSPTAQLPEIMLHIKDQILHYFWQFNLLFRLIEMCETFPVLANITNKPTK